MADQHIADSGAGGGDVARLVALTERQQELWELLRDSKDDGLRDELLDELTANRAELAQLKQRAGGTDIQLPAPRPPSPAPIPAEADGPRTVGEQLRSRIMGSSPEVAPPQPPPPPPPPPILIEPSAVRDVDVRVDLVSSRGAGDTAQAPKDDVEDAFDGGTVPASAPPDATEPEVPEVPVVPVGRVVPEVVPVVPEVPEVPEVVPVVPEVPVVVPVVPEVPEVVPVVPEVPVVVPVVPEVPVGRAESVGPVQSTSEPEGLGEQETDGGSAMLLPEKRPYRTREDDLAESRTRRDTPERSRPEPAPVRHTPEVLEELRHAAHETYREINRVRSRPRTQSQSMLHLVLAILVAVAAVVASVWFLFLFERTDTDQVPRTTTTTTTAPSQEAAPAVTEQIQAVVDGLGRGSVTVEESSGTIYLIGAVPTEADRQAVVSAAEALADTKPVNSTALSVIYHDDDLRIAVLNTISAAGYDRLNASVTDGVVTLDGVTPDDGTEELASVVTTVEGVTEVIDKTERADRAPALAVQLDRVTNLTPIVFEEGQTSLNALQEGVLDDVAGIIGAYSGPMVTIVSYADSEAVARDRAEQARDRLIDRGVTPDRLAVAATTERGTADSETVIGFGRRIEFEAGYAVAAKRAPDFRIGVVASGTRDDYSSSQSIIDAALAIAMERTDVGVDISDGMTTLTDLEVAVRGYAREGYDLVIVHGSEFGPAVATIAADYPNVAFAWGDASDTFGLPNVSAYQVAADQGGYIMGTLAAQLSESGVIGIVGPSDTGDDARYIAGFAAGVTATDPQLTVLTTYTDSTEDTALAAERAAGHIASGADVLTGSGEQATGALDVAAENAVPWFGNQADPARLAPDLVVASQVYHWEVALRQIVSGIDEGTLGGQAYTLNLANGGIVVDYNPDYPLTAELLAATDEVTTSLVDGSISTGI